MKPVTGKIEFDNMAAKLGGRLVSLDQATRQQAALDAAELLADLPKFLRNSPHCSGEIAALNILLSRATGV
jgi:hypothetical protein